MACMGHLTGRGTRAISDLGLCNASTRPASALGVYKNATSRITLVPDIATLISTGKDMLPTITWSIAALGLAGSTAAGEYDLYTFLLSSPLERRQQTRTCNGQTVFQTCPDGRTCAPSGFYCCGRELSFLLFKGVQTNTCRNRSLHQRIPMPWDWLLPTWRRGRALPANSRCSR